MNLPLPRPIAVLGLDEAACTGWGIHAGGRIVAHGVARNWQERDAVIELARNYCELSLLLVVYEDHSGISLKAGRQRGKAPTRNTATILGLGHALGCWDDALDRKGHREAYRMGVEPKDWRLRVLGLSEHESREVCKREALKWASATLYKQLTSEDEAEGVCIACWGALDGIAAWEAKRLHKRAIERGRRELKKQAVLPLGRG